MIRTKTYYLREQMPDRDEELELQIIIHQNVTELRQACKDYYQYHNMEYDLQCTIGVTHSHRVKPQCCTIRLSKDNLTYSVLAHELLHAACTFHRVGFDLENLDLKQDLLLEESIAHLQTRLFRRVMQLLPKRALKYS